MPKPRIALEVPLEPYPPSRARRNEPKDPKQRWQDRVRREVNRKARKRDISSYADEFLAIEVRFYVEELDGYPDLDNLAKLIGDALQGNMPSQKKKAFFKKRLLPNDRRICKWTITKFKRSSTKQKSKLYVRRYRPQTLGSARTP